MTLSRAIDLMQTMLQRHGDVEVMFDCPNCEQSFAPGSLVKVAVVLSSVDATAAETGRETDAGSRAPSSRG